MIEINLSDTVSFVTGAASGIGQSIAVALASCGSIAALVDRDAVGLAQTRDLIANAGGRSSCYELDLLDLAAIDPTVDAVLAEHGRIDILVNAAGITHSESILDLPDAVWDRVQTIDLKAPMMLIRKIGRHMTDRGSGRIVNISSSSAFRADPTAPPAYASAKAGLDALTRSAAAILGPHGITVNSVAPGVTNTPLMREFIDPEMVKSGPLTNLTHAISEPEDIANLVAFLCSGLARQITAQSIHVSAGNVV